MERIRQQDLRALLEFLRGCYVPRDLDAWVAYLIRALPQVVRFEMTTYNEVNPRGQLNFIRFHEGWYGAYLQDQIGLKHGLYLLVGGCYDVTTVSNGFSTVTPDMPILNRTDQAFSPRVGLLYQRGPGPRSMATS